MLDNNINVEIKRKYLMEYLLKSHFVPQTVIS